MERECKHPTCGSTCRRPKKEKKIYRLQPSAAVKKQDAIIDKAEMDLYWLTAEKELAAHPYCMECNAFIPEKFYRAATAHVLPKRKEYGFPSVAANLLNKIFLGAGCGCHNRYDSSWEDAAKMNIWPRVVQIFKLLYPFIHPSERKNIPDILLKELG